MLVSNMLLSRHPLYRVPEWASLFVPELLGLPPGDSELLNDDRIGRCLDLLYESDRASFLTSFLCRLFEEFHLDLEVLHNDSTSVTFTGRYSRRPAGALWITHGYSKDHRPDLKQLVFELTVTEDGAVPILVALHDGNTTDDQTHRQTWDRLRKLVGRPDFIYVADCKACVSDTMTHITRNGGHFVTILPATRKEEGWFKEWLQTHPVAWQDVFSRPPLRRQSDPPDDFTGFESPVPSAEGFRIVWYHSSDKHRRDQEYRQSRIQRAIADLEFLNTKTGTYYLKTLEQVQQAAHKTLDQTGAQRWIEVSVRPAEKVEYRQAHAGRPGPQTPYRQVKRPWPQITWRVREEIVVWDAKIDGLFPLITDLPRERADLKQVLLWYKYQPRLEKRFEQLKNVFEVRPVFLKKVERVEAFLLLYFITLIVQALIERQLRLAMERSGVAELPLYPERRLCKAPTAERVLELFQEVRRHRLLRGDEEVDRFYDKLSPLQEKVLELLGVARAAFSI
jgi:transposase